MLRWFPWRYVVRRVARARGLIDPVKVLSRLESFAQPVEVKEPLELLRAGMVFHARGLLNSAIQHNLDWVWPLWVERQYDPRDVAFIPRAFSITHVNLTHRNWTAIGLPDVDALPIVDPAGLLTPNWDGWSLDAWILGDDRSELLPSRCDRPEQVWDLNGSLAVITRCAADGLQLETRAEVVDDGRAICRLRVEAAAERPAWLAILVRPYNPEGVSFVHRLHVARRGRSWRVGRRDRVELDRRPDAYALSDYAGGDVRLQLPGGAKRRAIRCRVGLATGAALYRLHDGHSPCRVVARVPLHPEGARRSGASGVDWPRALAGACRVRLGSQRDTFLFDAALRSLVLHSPGKDVYPGPYTYKRFWFRDATFILNALLTLGLSARVRRTLDGFPARQTSAGFFHSQDGEWDSNGQALWIMERYGRLTGVEPDPAWREAVARGVAWLRAKRLSDRGRAVHRGLLPAGFSAEHLGPSDYYYWDDFWAVAGLRAATVLLRHWGRRRAAEASAHEAELLMAAIERSLRATAERLGRPAMPASPHRRYDSGAIGSLVAGYPLHLLGATDERLVDTAQVLLERCFVDGGFFQDMVHSGINPYLTLHVAQVMLRAGDPRAQELIATVAGLATATGQWPEAVHPRTGGGCMGDGHHVWAAAEWAMALRNAFVLEEEDGLVLGASVAERWLDGDGARLGPTLTPWGPIEVRVERRGSSLRVAWRGDWRHEAPAITVRLPGREAVEVPAGATEWLLETG